MGVEWTEKQKEVIDTRDCNLLVSAAAGSGKTAVLVERIIQRILKEHINIDEILVLTFTNAAAGEMKERIRKAILAKLEETPEDAFLQRQATLIHNAQITTIHSFGLFLIRNHFNEIGLDPAFRVAEDGEMKLLEKELLEELLEEQFEAKTPEFLSFVETFSTGNNDRNLGEMIQALSEYSESAPWPDKWLLQRMQDYSVTEGEVLEDSELCLYLKRFLKGILAGYSSKLGEALRLATMPDGPYMYAERIEKEQAFLEKAGRKDALFEMLAALAAIPFENLSPCKDKTVDNEKKEQVKALRTKVKDGIGGVLKEYGLINEELIALQNRALEGPVRTLIELTLLYRQKLLEEKKQRRIITTSDMEHFALDILLKDENGEIVPTAVAKEYRKHFKEIMTDEYQDSNLVQEYLLAALSDEEDGRYDRFMVGDVKQSIYKFRLAKPELFLEKYDSYSEGEGKNRKICLAQNFRSRGEVVDAVNAVFERIMQRDKGGIEYDTDARLNLGANYPAYEEAKAEFLLMEKPSKDTGYDSAAAEARMIAEKIKQYLAEYKVYDSDTKTMRAARFSDMVILMRSTTAADTYKKILEQQGIPAYIASKAGYFEATEVRTLLNLLRVLDNPLQDIPLFGVLVSVFGGFDENELARLKGESEDKKLSLYGLLMAAREQSPKIHAFLTKLEHYRSYTDYMPVRELLETLVKDYDYLNYVAALPMGERRLANVEVLLNMASNYGKTSYYGVFHFVRYIELLQKYEQDQGEAEVMDENANVVRMMTIHKSKGLEFPIVFVAGLGRKFNDKDNSGDVLIDGDLGVGVKYFNPTSRVSMASLRRKVIAQRKKEENRGEELRVLYVALTRAKEKLVLTASVDSLEKAEKQMTKKDTETLEYAEFVSAGSYLDFLLPIIRNCPFAYQTFTLDDIEHEEVIQTGSRIDKKLLLDRMKSEGTPVSLQELFENLQRTYPHTDLEGLTAKTTVSELKIAAMADVDEAAYHAFEEKELVPYIPAFKRAEEEVSGAIRGTAYHRVMELLDFTQVLGDMTEETTTYSDFASKMQENLLNEKVKDHLDKLAESGKLQEQYRKIVNVNKITRFILSKLGYRMYRAQLRGDLYREQPFVLGIAANRLNADYPKDEQVLIQGIIDAFFVEDGNLILLDYKTDTVDSLESLWDRYRTQIDYYEEALTRLMCLPVSEAYLYSFKLEAYEL